MALLITLTIFITVAASAYAIMSGREAPDLERRLGPTRAAMGDYGSAPEPAPSSGIPLAIMNAAHRFLPSEMMDAVQTMLTRAGNPVDLQRMMMIWTVGILGVPAVYAVLVLSRGSAPSPLQLLTLAICPVLGFYLPKLWLSRKIGGRRKMILRTLPDAMDLITTSVEAGLGIDAAFARVADKIKGALSDEFRRCLREMALGRTRREALTDFAERVELDDINTFIHAVIQAEHMGVSLGRVMRIQADQLRTRRKQRAEQEAQKAPVKMVVPLVLFIFPAMFIVILGPAAIQIFNNR
jgi:tight adherence protein C